MLCIYGIVISLLLTFLISGIWHGAKITYIVWGLMQGILLSIEALTHTKRSLFEKKYSLNRIFIILISIVSTYILFSASLVISHAQNIKDAFFIFSKILTEHGSPYLDLTTLTYAGLGASLLFIKDLKDEYFPNKFKFFNSSRIVVRFSSYLLIIFMILVLGVFDGAKFIYFQF